MDYAKESLRLHEEWGGKIEVIATVPVKTKEDLSLAYTPGVAQPCLEIQKDVNKSYELTRRHNMCLVVTDGTAVLGLGDIGPEAGMPVMEGKCVLFKAFGDVDAFPLCVKSKDVDEIVNTIYMISGSFGGVNLEDIAAPRCFEIERKLKEKCDIPIDVYKRQAWRHMPEKGHTARGPTASPGYNLCLLYTSEIIIKHVLPNTFASIMVFATLAIANGILTEAALSFLGLGVRPPQPSWGNMLSAAQSMRVLQYEWWMWRCV